ncbi:MAG: MarR family winged helix-turn-helix transcriptional regulator [Egibacteraceae bacterium]
MGDDVARGPRGRVAPDTHALELRRLALQESTHPDCDPLNVQALIWLFRAYNAAVNAQAEELRPLGLSPSAFNVLMALHNSSDCVLEPCQLAERLLVSRPSVTGLLDTLQAKGLIARTPHPDDRRRVLVALTHAGLALLEAHFDNHYREQNAVFADLEPDERAQLVTLLRRVRGAVPADLREGVLH